MRDEWGFEFLFETDPIDRRDVRHWGRDFDYSIEERREFAQTLADIRMLPEVDHA